MPRTPEDAIAWGRAQIRNPTQDWSRLCLSFVRQSFGVDYIGNWPNSERNAGRAWDRAQFKHRTSDPNAIPRGVPVFFETKGEADHVALSLGGGICLSNDFQRDGQIDVCRIDRIAASWGPLVGWTEDLVGNRVAPAPEEKPAVVTPLRIDGVDISHHQDGPIDYTAAKNAGVKWIYHKATEGATVVDENYDRRRAEAKAAGIPFGAYHFARPSGNDAALEARKFLAVAKPLPGDLVPMLDLEDTGGLSRPALTRWVGAWVAQVRAATGVRPLIYVGRDETRGLDIDLDKTFKCGLIAPRYNPENAPPRVAKPWKTWTVRQFSNGVIGVPNRVPGFGNVDLNAMRDGLTVADLLIPEPVPAGLPLTVATWNARIVNADQRSGFQALVSALQTALGYKPDAVGVQEGAQLAALTKLGVYKVYSYSGEGGLDRNPILVRRWLKVSLQEWHPGSPSLGTGVNSLPRSTWVVGFTKKARKVAVVNTHMPFVAPGAFKSQAARAHEEMAAGVLEVANRLRSEGWVVFVTGDGNYAKNDWDGALHAQLRADGWQVQKNRLDIVASHPSQVASPAPQVVPAAVTGSDHDAVAVKTEVVETPALARRRWRRWKRIVRRLPKRLRPKRFRPFTHSH